MDTRNRYYKVITLVVIFIVICFSTTSCHRSNFDILTNNGVAYWKGLNFLHSFSGKDSITLYLNDDLTQVKQSIWEIKYKNKFRFSGDTLFTYIKHNDFYYEKEAYIVLNLSKDKMVFYNARCTEDDTMTWHRLSQAEVKRRKRSRYENWHNYELKTANIKISLPRDYTEEKKIYEDGVAYYIESFDDAVTMVIAEGNIPDANDYMKSNNCIPKRIKSRKGKEIFYGKCETFNYRTDIINNVHISYFHVRNMDKPIYDKVFDDIKYSVK